MVKSGLIFGAVMFVAALVITLFVPYCVPCVALLIGLAAGYVAGNIGKPLNQPAATKSGAIAGAIAGAGVLIGEMIGAGINGAMMGPAKVAQLLQQFGFTSGTQMGTGEYWAILLGENCVIALISVALMAGLGALGGLLWWNANKNKQVLTPPPPTL